MNKERRSKLSKALAFLSNAEQIVDGVLEEEIGTIDNMPENLENSERYQKMESAIENLEEAIDNIGRASQCIEDASE